MFRIFKGPTVYYSFLESVSYPSFIIKIYYTSLIINQLFSSHNVYNNLFYELKLITKNPLYKK